VLMKVPFALLLFVFRNSIIQQPSGLSSF